LLKLSNAGITFLGTSTNVRLKPSNNTNTTTLGGPTLSLSGDITNSTTTSVLITATSPTHALTGSNTGTILNINEPSFQPASGSYNLNFLLIDGTLAQGGSSNGIIRGIRYNPSGTPLGTHYGITVDPTGALNGFGTPTPTATMHVVGSTKLDGNVTLVSAGNGLLVKEGTNATMGIATLTAGTVTVSTTKVTANSRIFLTVEGGTLTNVGSPYISARTAGTSFTVSSTNVLDAANVSWFIVEPAP
jgi:hypothetical protein